MTHPETHLVTPENGPRPAGRPDQCFYCQQPLGAEHASDCACRLRTVVVEARIRHVITVPVCFTPAEYRHNESTWCSNNAFSEIEHAFAKDSERNLCACDSIEVAFVREASAEDDARYNVTEELFK